MRARFVSSRRRRPGVSRDRRCHVTSVSLSYARYRPLLLLSASATGVCDACRLWDLCCRSLCQSPSPARRNATYYPSARPRFFCDLLDAQSAHPLDHLFSILAVELSPGRRVSYVAIGRQPGVSWVCTPLSLFLSLSLSLSLSPSPPPCLFPSVMFAGRSARKTWLFDTSEFELQRECFGKVPIDPQTGAPFPHF